MRKNQWKVLGWGFLIIGIFIQIFKEFIIKSIFSLGLTSGATNDLVTLGTMILFILNMASLIFFGLVILFWINAWLEGRAEKSKMTTELGAGRVKELILEIAEKLKLKTVPHDMHELFYIARKEGKTGKMTKLLAKSFHEMDKEE